MDGTAIRPKKEKGEKKKEKTTQEYTSCPLPIGAYLSICCYYYDYD